MARQSVLTAAGESHPETAARGLWDFCHHRELFRRLWWEQPPDERRCSPALLFSLIPADFKGSSSSSGSSGSSGSWSSSSSSSVPERFHSQKKELVLSGAKGFFGTRQCALNLRETLSQSWSTGLLTHLLAHSLTGFDSYSLFIHDSVSENKEKSKSAANSLR